MHRRDEVARVAVVADPTRLAGSRLRLLEALSQVELPGFALELCAAPIPAGSPRDLIHLLGARDPGASVAVAREHAIHMIASYPEAPRRVSPGQCRLILSPTPSADLELIAAGAQAAQLVRWQPGVDPESFGPGHYTASLLSRQAGELHVLHVGEPEDPELLESVFAAAAAHEPRLRLTVLGAGADLPRLYASADLLLHLDDSADFPLEILEAQASGLPVLALDTGATRELVQDGRSGVLVPADPRAIAEALLSLARRATLRERLTVGGLQAVRPRTWERSLAELTGAWHHALSPQAMALLRAA